MKPVLSSNKNKNIVIKSLRESCKKFLDSHKKKLEKLKEKAKEEAGILIPGVDPALPWIDTFGKIVMKDYKFVETTTTDGTSGNYTLGTTAEDPKFTLNVSTTAGTADASFKIQTGT